MLRLSHMKRTLKFPDVSREKSSLLKFPKHLMNALCQKDVVVLAENVFYFY